MTPLVTVILIVAVALALAFRRSSLTTWTGCAAGAALLVHLSGDGLSIVTWTVLAISAAMLNLKGLRRRLLSARLLRWFRKSLPPISATEKEALDAGTVWWDGELFSGQPEWKRLLDTPSPELSAEEKAYLDGPVSTLCGMLDDWSIENDQDLPPEVWKFLKQEKFFGMIIPKQYGGLEFSARAQSDVIVRIASRSLATAVTVMVPNSLGPGELLMHYGTKEQKDHYLPRLADGREVPAFALTGPMSGSDAGGMSDVGVVCRGTYQGRDTLGFRVNWSKRYITLGPVCSLLGLAFRAEDPDGLLGPAGNLGITCALIPTDTPGVDTGMRHDPGSAFQNGPNSGKDVFVPMEWIIGGQAQVGKGWKMLMECLAVGRAISLPALATASGKLASLSTGAYARVRRQFRTPIARFEGVDEMLARIGGLTYTMESGRLMTAGALALGHKPSVISAILKYNNTESMRTVVNAAMDVHAGKAVCRGPSNYLNSAYQAVPVAITVEGANILTRTMIVFGQGAIRCHPFVLKEMLAASDLDQRRGLEDFDKALFAHMGFTLSNAVRSLILGLGGDRFVPVPEIGAGTAHLRRLSRLSAAFAFAADIALLTLGGDLKRREKLSGRFADVLSQLYLASAAIKRFEDDGRPDSDLPLFHWSVEESLAIAEERLHQICANFPIRGVGALIRLFALPLGRRLRPPSDRLGTEVTRILTEPGAARDRLVSGVYFEATREDPVGVVELAMHKGIAAEPVEKKIRKATGRHVTPFDYEEAVSEALQAGEINQLEARAVHEAMDLAAKTIDVDSFGESRPVSETGSGTEAVLTG